MTSVVEVDLKNVFLSFLSIFGQLNPRQHVLSVLAVFTFCVKEALVWVFAGLFLDEGWIFFKYHSCTACQLDEKAQTKKCFNFHFLKTSNWMATPWTTSEQGIKWCDMRLIYSTSLSNISHKEKPINDWWALLRVLFVFRHGFVVLRRSEIVNFSNPAM